MGQLKELGQHFPSILVLNMLFLAFPTWEKHSQTFLKNVKFSTSSNLPHPLPNPSEKNPQNPPKPIPNHPKHHKNASLT